MEPAFLAGNLACLGRRIPAQPAAVGGGQFGIAGGRQIGQLRAGGKIAAFARRAALPLEQSGRDEQQRRHRAQNDSLHPDSPRCAPRLA